MSKVDLTKGYVFKPDRIVAYEQDGKKFYRNGNEVVEEVVVEKPKQKAKPKAKRGPKPAVKKD